MQSKTSLKEGLARCVSSQKVLSEKAFTYFIHDLDDETGILFIHFKDEILEEEVLLNLWKIWLKFKKI